ncbi:MAG: hypothetical protein OK438_01115 [Thaumarchaeota archaeon]|nr:hypothetical protein [Nitrososphaerota archaeon]
MTGAALEKGEQAGERIKNVLKECATRAVPDKLQTLDRCLRILTNMPSAGLTEEELAKTRHIVLSYLDAELGLDEPRGQETERKGDEG